ncbi:MAG: M1 family metallopeptidase [Bacillota bacterium]
MIRKGLSRRWLLLTLTALMLTISMAAARFEVLERAAFLTMDVNLPGGKNITQYTIDVDLDGVEKILTANEKVIYYNQSDTDFNALYFHIYPNAFKSKDTTPFDKEEMDLAYPEGFEPGEAQIRAVKIDSENLNFAIIGVGDSILKVILNKALEPGDKVTLDIEFAVKIPPAQGRFGFGEYTVNMGNWYPILCVFDDKGWHLEPYYSIGDPFYSESANYRVAVSAPPEYTIASTGNIVKKENRDGKVLWTLEAKAVRDFAMIASEKYSIMEDEVDGIKIYSYYIDGEVADMALEAARDSIKIFNDTFGKYPYKQFSVAASNFYVGGMEYPNLVYINQAFYQNDRKDILEYVIAHEAAHQWWYGVVGNDEVNEAWLDEALTEYSTLLYYEKKYGKEAKDHVYKNIVVKSYDLYRNDGKNREERVCRSLKEFKDSSEYQALVYNKGAMFIEDLRREMGDEVFFQTLKIYFDKYKFKNATTEDFITVCEQISNKELRQSFQDWLMYEKE